MATDIPVRCTCGAFRGVLHDIAPGRVIHGVCYCDDCQAFARHLGAADAVLDEYGGTEVVQMSPARLEIVDGRARLACLRLTARGPLRWYLACCRTPLGNTPATRQLPFVGVIGALVRSATDAAALDAAIGPVRFRVFGEFARGRPHGDVHPRVPLSAVPPVVRLILGARLRGDHRRSPFFTPAGAPVATPVFIGTGEQQEARRRR